MPGRVRAKNVDLNANAWVYILKKDCIRVRPAYIEPEQQSQLDSRGIYLTASTHQGGYKVPYEEMAVRVDFGCAYSWSKTRCDRKMVDALKKAALEDAYSRLDRARFKCRQCERSISVIEKIQNVVDVEGSY